MTTSQTGSRIAETRRAAVRVPPPQVTDAMAGALRNDNGVDALVELAMMVAVQNERSRFDVPPGLTSQGFSDRSEIRPRP